MYVIAPLYIHICENASAVNPLVPIGGLMILSIALIYHLRETSETKLEDYLPEE